MNKLAPPLAAGALVLLLVVALMVYSKQEAEPPEPPTPARPALIDADRVPRAATPPRAATRPPTAEATPAAAETGAETAGAEAEPAPADELEPQDKGGQAPSGELTRRFDVIIAAMPAESQPSELNWNCSEDGIDCSVTGYIGSNEALADFAKRLEGPNPSGGTDRAPTVEIHKIEQTEDGKAFEIGVLIP